MKKREREKAFVKQQPNITIHIPKTDFRLKNEFNPKHRAKKNQKQENYLLN